MVVPALSSHPSPSPAPCQGGVITRKDSAVTERHPPSSHDPAADDSDDLPSVFDGLVGIDVVDGELVPRAAKPPRE